MSDLGINIKKYFKFSTTEIKDLLVISFVYGVILGWNDGYETFVVSRWILNLITSFIFSFLIITVHEVGRKLIAIRMGYTAEFKPWWILVGISFFVSFFTDGMVEVLLPATGVVYSHVKSLRLGKFRRGHNFLDNSYMSYIACVWNVILMYFIKLFFFLPSSEVLAKLAALSGLYAILNLIPFDIPKAFMNFRYYHGDAKAHKAPMDGTYMLYHHRTLYAFYVISIVTMVGLGLYLNIFIALPLALIISVIGALYYGIKYDKLL